jgi:hypothetical protein
MSTSIELEDEFWPPCIACGKPAAHFIDRDAIVCESCYAEEFRK